MSSSSQKAMEERDRIFRNGNGKRKSNDESREVGENLGGSSSCRLVEKKHRGEQEAKLPEALLKSSKCSNQSRTCLNSRASNSSRGQLGEPSKQSGSERNSSNEGSSFAPKRVLVSHDEKQCSATSSDVTSVTAQPVTGTASAEGSSAGEQKSLTLFTDNEFPPNEESLYGPGGKASVSGLPQNKRIPLDLVWGRPEKGEIKDTLAAVTDDWVLFRFQPSPNDILQGCIGIYLLIVPICQNRERPSNSPRICY